MKLASSIVRKLGKKGKLVLPVELRRWFDIDTGIDMEIFTDDDSIILCKYEPRCVFCGSTSEITIVKGKAVCSECLSALWQI